MFDNHISVSKETFETLIKNYPRKLAVSAIDYFGTLYHMYFDSIEFWGGHEPFGLSGAYLAAAHKTEEPEQYSVSKEALDFYKSTDVSKAVRCSDCKYFLNEKCKNPAYISLKYISAGEFSSERDFCILGEKYPDITFSRHVDPEKLLYGIEEKILESAWKGNLFVDVSDNDKEKFDKILSDQKSEEVLTLKEIHNEIMKIFSDEYDKRHRNRNEMKDRRKDELKTCPFCGGEAEFIVHIDDSPGRKKMGVSLCSVGVRCSKCSLAGFQPPTSHVPFDSLDEGIEELRDKAIKFWNERA